MNNEIMNLNANLDNMNQDKDRLNNENEKYKAHIMFLTETNQKLINELEAISERDHQIKMILSQGNDIPYSSFKFLYIISIFSFSSSIYFIISSLFLTELITLFIISYFIVL